MIGDKQHCARQGLAEVAYAEPEDAYQGGRPPTRHPVIQTLAADAHPIGQGIEHNQRQRKRNHDVQQQQGRAPQVTPRLAPVTAHARNGFDHGIHLAAW